MRLEYFSIQNSISHNNDKEVDSLSMFKRVRKIAKSYY